MEAIQIEGGSIQVACKDLSSCFIQQRQVMVAMISEHLVIGVQYLESVLRCPDSSVLAHVRYWLNRSVALLEVVRVGVIACWRLTVGASQRSAVR
jgi:hypothetical protein